MAEAPRIFSRKLFKRLVPGDKTPWPGNKHLPAMKWLHPTVRTHGAVLENFQPLVGALQHIAAPSYAVQLAEFRNALKNQQHNDAVKHWQNIRAQVSAKPSRLRWSNIATNGFLGSSLFINALNDISRHVRQYPELVKRIVHSVESEGALDGFVLGHVLSQRGETNFNYSLELLNSGWSEGARILGITALLDSISMEPPRVCEVLKSVEIPPDYTLSSHLVRKLSAQVQHRDAPAAFRAIASEGLFNPRQPALGQLLRRLYSVSDEGAEAVIDACCQSESKQSSYPHNFYPFLVRVLSAKVSSGSEAALAKLDILFDTVLADLAVVKPGLVLSMLIQRTIATSGVQGTGPILSRWTNGGHSVSEETWLQLFQAFRRMGLPDKCADVLKRAMQEPQTQLSMPFFGEYLAFVARFCNVYVYLDRFSRAFPESEAVIRELGVSEYVQNNLSHLTNEDPLTDLPLLNPENREFDVTPNTVHESWLVFTYQAVLATVDDMDTAVKLFNQYLAYIETHTTGTSLRVVDQFVQLLLSTSQLTKCTMPRVDMAEDVFRQALERIPLRHPVDGKNNSKSLEALCFRLTRSGKVERAVQLLFDTAKHDRAVLRGSALQPWITAVPIKLRAKLITWASQQGMHVTDIE